MPHGKHPWCRYDVRHALIGDSHATRVNATTTMLAYSSFILPAYFGITQNVDGLHRDAGSSEVIELHGNCREVSRLQPYP